MRLASKRIRSTREGLLHVIEGLAGKRREVVSCFASELTLDPVTDLKQREVC